MSFPTFLISRSNGQWSGTLASTTFQMINKVASPNISLHSVLATASSRTLTLALLSWPIYVNTEWIPIKPRLVRSHSDNTSRKADSHMSFRPLSVLFIAPHHLIKIPRSNQEAEVIPWRCFIYIWPQNLCWSSTLGSLYTTKCMENQRWRSIFSDMYINVSLVLFYIFTNETSTNSC